MDQNVIYVGLDVDDVRYHGSALDKQTGEVLDFHCCPTLKGLVQQLEKVHQYFGGDTAVSRTGHGTDLLQRHQTSVCFDHDHRDRRCETFRPSTAVDFLDGHGHS